MTLSPIASALNSLSETIQAHPEKARAKYAAMGGTGTGPNPGWFLRPLSLHAARP